jgi:signal transduction histidine kinase
MESRSKPLLVYSFGGLLLLTALAGLAGLVILERVRAGEAELRMHHQNRSTRLHQVRTGILLSGTLARDYFANPHGEDASGLRTQLREVETRTRAALEEDADRGETTALPLRAEVGAYWKVLELMGDMARKQPARGVDLYFQNQLAQRRATMLRIADDVEAALARELRSGEEQAAALYWRLRTAMAIILVLLAATGGLLSWAMLRRLVKLESDARGLSMRLVRAQEEERRAIARELHDEVGQWLSALRLDAGHALAGGGHSPAKLESIANLAERSIEALRRIALSLRPSMLDDLGLVPALEWQARETASRSAMHIEVTANEEEDGLPETHRTCIFRVAQEALRNCARHSEAKRVEVALERTAGAVRLRVNDNGKGFSSGRTRGLGLLGMEERVGQLGGRLLIEAEPGRGTRLIAELPL